MSVVPGLADGLLAMAEKALSPCEPLLSGVQEADTRDSG